MELSAEQQLITKKADWRIRGDSAPYLVLWCYFLSHEQQQHQLQLGGAQGWNQGPHLVPF
jgi:hypothetical protein